MKVRYIRFHKVIYVILAACLIAPACFADKKTVSTKWGDITVESKVGGPPYEITTKHYSIYSEIDKLDPIKDIGKILEAAWPVRKEFFDGREPKIGAKKLRVEIYANESAYKAAGVRDRVPVGGGGYYWTGNSKTYLFWQPAGVYFTRYLMLHETGHQFHYKAATGNRGATGWMNEAMAEYLSYHKWDGENFSIGILPNKHILRDRPKVALSKMSGTPGFQLVDSRKGYEECWAIIHFLINNYPFETKKLMAGLNSKKSIGDSWKAAFDSNKLPPGFEDKYKDWLEHMKTFPDDVVFTTWDNMLARSPVRARLDIYEDLVAKLGKHAPSAMVKLRDDLKAMANPSSGPTVNKSATPVPVKKVPSWAKKRSIAKKAVKKSSGASVAAAARADVLIARSIPLICREMVGSKLAARTQAQIFMKMTGAKVSVTLQQDKRSKGYVNCVVMADHSMVTPIRGQVTLKVSPENALRRPMGPMQFTVSKTKPMSTKSILLVNNTKDAQPFQAKAEIRLKYGESLFVVSQDAEWVK